MRREGVEVQKVQDEALLRIWQAVETGKAAREVVPDLIKSIASGCSFDEAVSRLAPTVSREDLECIVRKIIDARSDFVIQKGNAALGPLMGLVMAEVRGSVDGKMVSETLRKEIAARLAKK